MPLIVIAGKPCSGKTTFAKHLQNYLKQYLVHKTICLINEESENITKCQGYVDSYAEKSTRAALKSRVSHLLTTDTYVIVDSLNYIKGYRYELFCIARSVRTSYCVCWVESPGSKISIKWNDLRLQNIGDGYIPTILKDLWIRFEMPNEKQRWDNPLFRIYNNVTSEDGNSFSSSSDVLSTQLISTKPSVTTEFTSFSSATLETTTANEIASIQPTKKSSWKPKIKTNPKLETESGSNDQDLTTVDTSVFVAQTCANNNTVDALSISGSMMTNVQEVDPEFVRQAYSFSCSDIFEKIMNHLSSATILTPNLATISVPKASTDLLYQLDSTSQKIVSQIIQQQNDCILSSTSNPIIFKECDRSLLLHRFVSQQELARHRKQFVKVNGTGTILAQLQLQANQACIESAKSNAMTKNQKMMKHNKQKEKKEQHQSTETESAAAGNINVDEIMVELKKLDVETCHVDTNTLTATISAYDFDSYDMKSTYINAQIGALFIDFLSSQL